MAEQRGEEKQNGFAKRCPTQGEKGRGGEDIGEPSMGRGRGRGRSEFFFK